MKTNLSYAIGRTAALILFLYPMATVLLPVGWENLTLGVLFHMGITWLNEYVHETPVV